MNLIVDIGNTYSKLAWFEQGRLIESRRMGESDLENVESIVSDKPILHTILSQVGAMDPRLRSALNKLKTNMLILDSTTRIPVDIAYRTPETLGHDRLAAAAGARYVCPLCNVMIVDMGTAITIDFVSAEGKFLGGNISPGMQIRYRALHQFTEKLPLVARDPEFPTFGTDTRSAIAAGVQQGIIFEINSYMDEYSKLYPACEFILTGGDAGFFVSKLKRSIFAIPELVLKGLNYILEFNTADNKP